MNIAIIGYGIQGQSAAEYWRAQGAEITICDQKTDVDVPEWAHSQLGEHHLDNLASFDLIVRSPIVHPRVLVDAAGESILEKVTSTTNEFFAVCPTKNIIGVTGTKGKGTTSTLITKMLEAAGKRVHLGGNIGLDPLQLFKNDIQSDDWVVLELANFQLIDLKHSPKIAVCLMVVPEHLNWHEDFEEYIAAKQQLFIHQNPDDIAIYYANDENSLSIADASEGILVPYMSEPGASVVENRVVIENQTLCTVDEIALLGKHNWQNICAAVTAVWQICQNKEAIHKVATTFAGLSHRIEFLRTKDDVTYYNDSFASGVHATQAACLAIDAKKVLIVGGYDRDLPLDHFADFIHDNARSFRKLLIIGAVQDKLAAALTAKGFDNFVCSRATTMSEVVKHAQSLAQDGDAVLLSPGFASFDMFKNFEDRGEQYRAAVADL